MLSAPGSSPVIGTPDIPTAPPPPEPVASAAPSLPTLPTITPTAPTSPATTPTVSASDDGTETSTTVAPASADHPMAHLMPARSAPSEASKRAAELRAAKKAKARKIKIGVAIGALAVAAIVGPPLGKWFVNAINESGSTSTEVDG